jgi:hypothetical protein
MNWWLISATGLIGLATLWILIRLVRKANRTDELQRINSDLNKDIDALVLAEHKQEKRESDHAKRVADIIRSHGISIDRVRELLNDYAPESEAARAAQPERVPR